METYMKVVAWNVAQNAKALSRTPAVRGADIYLLNEAPRALELGDLLMKADDRTIALDCPHAEGLCTCNRRWSAAVAVPPRHGVERIKDARRSESSRVLRFEPSRKGSWIAALVSLEGGEHVTAISLYGLRGGERSDESVHRSLSELSPVFDHERYGRLLVLGGDLNTLARAEIGSRALARDQGVLDRITKGFGLVDLLAQDIRKQKRGPLEECGCGYGPNCEHTWTFRHKDNPTTKYQDDYLFASPELAERLDRCEAIPFTAASDHTPIVAMFVR
jgi:endonuclease/exonuclease/phosphatase (EEP) superfamily protein YafD